MLKPVAKGFSRSAVEELSRLKSEPDWLLQKRLQAWDSFEQLAAPLGRRGDLGTLRTVANFDFQQLIPYVPAERDQIPASLQESLQQSLVDERSGLILQHNSSIVHNDLQAALSEQGVVLTDLNTAVREHPELVQKYFMTRSVPVETSKYTALHAAFWNDGIFLYIPKGVEIEAPVLAQIYIDAASASIFTHTLIIAEERSSIRFVEEFTSGISGDQTTLVSDVVEVYAENEAHVEFSNMQDLGQNVWQITNKNGIHEKDGTVTFVLAELGSHVNLVNIGAGLHGNGSAGELVGVFFTDHEQRYSIKSLSDHIGLSTNAETLVKGVLTDASRVEFDGMIRVRPKAQQTASFLSAHGLLLSKKARGEFIPGLEIAANEVSASHGATSGQIDEEQLFYLMVRGIPRPEAERIIVQGFFEPVLQRIPIEQLRVRLRRSIVRRMSGEYQSEADTWVDAQERWEIEDVDEHAVHLDDSTRPNDEIQLAEY